MPDNSIPTEKDLNQIALYLTRQNPERMRLLAEALYEHYKEKFSKGGIRISEDRRFSDFIFLLPRSNKDATALIIGCGKGLFPIWLSSHFERLTAIDTRYEIVEFINTFANFYGNKNNLSALKITTLEDIKSHLSNCRQKYDNVILLMFSLPPTFKFSALIKEVCKYIKPDGYLIAFVENIFSWKQIIRQIKSTLAHDNIYSKAEYLEILKNTTFYKDITIYAPLPFYNQNPLFYLPISVNNNDKNNVAKYFFNNVFCLFDMVSPEIKKKYTVELFVSRILVKIAIYLHLTNFLVNFVSGYIIIAKKNTSQL